MSLVLMPNPTREDGVAVQIGGRLAKLRLALGLSQEEMADMMGAGRTTAAAWERGQNVADVLAVARLSPLYGPVLEWVFNGSVAGIPYDIAQKLLSPSDEPEGSIRRVKRAS